MLYAECKQYLIAKLREAGIKTRIYTTKKSLEKCMESHVGAVLFEREECARNGSKKRYRDEEGAKHKRRRVFDRSITFSTVIGEYTDDAAEEIFERFLASRDHGGRLGLGGCRRFPPARKDCRPDRSHLPRRAVPRYRLCAAAAR